MDSCGLYIHIPFCKSKCFYCDFPSYPHLEKHIPDYMEALRKEIHMVAKRYSNYRIKSIFIGGGTPTYIHGTEITRLMDTIRGCFLLEEDIEVSIEANPGTFDLEKMLQLRRAGVNRVSIGLQAWQDQLLRSLGRIHRRQEFVEGFYAAREAGFCNINVDLMFGLPQQNLQDWIETLERVLELQPAHLSCYSLNIEESTVFYRLWEAGGIQVNEDLEREMYYYTREQLKSRGFAHYEISNFSRPGFECRHNLIYWELIPYIGVGTSAHSFINQTRYSNVDSISNYIQRLENNEPPVKNQSRLSPTELMEEFMFLGLRKIKGISIVDFYNIFGMDFFTVYGQTIKELKRKDLIKITENISLTDKGLDYANLVYQSFLLP